MNKNVEDYERQRNKQVAKMRSVLDYVMGAAIVMIGIHLIYRYKSDITLLAFGTIAVLYGCWRLYRGYKKNYFR